MISNQLLITNDLSPLGMEDPDCFKLAELASQAVDFNKVRSLLLILPPRLEARADFPSPWISSPERPSQFRASRRRRVAVSVQTSSQANLSQGSLLAEGSSSLRTSWDSFSEPLKVSVSSCLYEESPAQAFIAFDLPSSCRTYTLHPEAGFEATSSSCRLLQHLYLCRRLSPPQLPSLLPLLLPTLCPRFRLVCSCLSRRRTVLL